MKLIPKIILCVLTFNSIFLVGCSDSKHNSSEAVELTAKQREIAQLKTYITELEQENAYLKQQIKKYSASTSDNVGQNQALYEFTDKNNTAWILTLNTDKTARLEKKGDENVYYGSWTKNLYQNSNSRGNVLVSFTSTPPIYFENEECFLSLVILGEYVYHGADACIARDPTQRLQIVKIQ